MFEAETGNETLIGSQTKIVITGINKNPKNSVSKKSNLPQQIASGSSDFDLNEAKLNTSETISLTNEAALVLKNSQQNTLSKKGNFCLSNKEIILKLNVRTKF